MKYLVRAKHCSNHLDCWTFSQLYEAQRLIEHLESARVLNGHYREWTQIMLFQLEDCEDWRDYVMPLRQCRETVKHAKRIGGADHV